MLFRSPKSFNHRRHPPSPMNNIVPRRPARQNDCTYKMRKVEGGDHTWRLHLSYSATALQLTNSSLGTHVSLSGGNHLQRTRYSVVWKGWRFRLISVTSPPSIFTPPACPSATVLNAGPCRVSVCQRSSQSHDPSH